MDKLNFLNIMKILGTAYNKEFTEEQIEVWYWFFKDYDEDKFNNAVKEMIKTSEKIPSIAEITKQIAKSETSNIPEAEDEWQEVLNVVKKYGTWNERDALNSLRPYTAKITTYIGFRRICQSTAEEQIWNKKEFISEYNALKDKLVEELQLGNNTNLLLKGE